MTSWDLLKICLRPRVFNYSSLYRGRISRYKLLESRLEETVQQTMKIKEEKITGLEKKLEESSTLNAALQSELTTVRIDKCFSKPFSDKGGKSVFLCLQVRQTVSALRQRQEAGGDAQQRSGSDRSATAELLRIKDHLIDVEKNVRRILTKTLRSHISLS